VSAGRVFVCQRSVGWVLRFRPTIAANGPGYPSGGAGRLLRKLACAASGSNLVACDSEGLRAAEVFSSVFLLFGLKLAKTFQLPIQSPIGDSHC